MRKCDACGDKASPVVTMCEALRLVIYVCERDVCRERAHKFVRECLEIRLARGSRRSDP